MLNWKKNDPFSVLRYGYEKRSMDKPEDDDEELEELKIKGINS